CQHPLIYLNPHVPLAVQHMNHAEVYVSKVQQAFVFVRFTKGSCVSQGLPGCVKCTKIDGTQANVPIGEAKPVPLSGRFEQRYRLASMGQTLPTMAQTVTYEG